MLTVVDPFVVFHPSFFNNNNNVPATSCASMLKMGDPFVVFHLSFFNNNDNNNGILATRYVKSG